MFEITIIFGLFMFIIGIIVGKSNHKAEYMEMQLNENDFLLRQLICEYIAKRLDNLTTTCITQTNNLITAHDIQNDNLSHLADVIKQVLNLVAEQNKLSNRFTKKEERTIL